MSARWPTDPRSHPLLRRAAGLGSCHAHAGQAPKDEAQLARAYASHMAEKYAPRIEHIVRAYTMGHAFRLENPLCT